MNDLIKEEFEIEEQAINLGIEKYVTQHRKAYDRNDTSSLAPENYLLRAAVPPVADKLKEHLKTTKGDAGYIKIRQTIMMAGFEETAFMALQTLFSLRTGAPLVRASVDLAKAIKMHLDHKIFKKAMPNYVKAIEQDMNSKTPSYKINVLRNIMGKKDIPTYPMTSQEERVKLGTFCIFKVLESVDLFEMYRKRASKGKASQVVAMNPLTSQWLENSHQQCAEMSAHFLPMVVKPSKWESMYSGGFLNCAGQYRVPAIRTRHKAKYTPEETERLKSVYSVLNTLQETPYRINKSVLEVMKVCKEHSLAGLPANDIALDLPPKPWSTEEEFEATSPEVVKEWKIKTSKVYDAWYRSQSKKMTLHWQTWIADKFADYEEIFMVWNCDWRGRVYPVQAYLNPQADGNGKALLEFAKGKRLGETGAYWLAVQGANVFGEDKLEMDARAQWAKDHTDLILDSANNPLDGEKFWMKADKPFGFLAFCFEWAGYIAHGDDFVSHLPVNMDGSCSGLQHYSALLRDEVGGKYVNLLPAQRPADVYMKVAEEAQHIVAKDTENPLAPLWNGKIDRTLSKRNCMTFSYSATLYGFAEQIADELKKRDEKLGGSYLGDNTMNSKASMYLAQTNLEAIKAVVKKAKVGMDWLQNVIEITSKAGATIKWTTPSGMTVHHNYFKSNTKRVNTFLGSTRVRVHVASDTQEPHVSKQMSAIAPNFIHSLDASHLALTVLQCVKEGIVDFAMIHDSFGCHASDVEKLNRILREEFVKMYSGDVLADFKEQLRAQLPAEAFEQLPPVPAKGNLDLNKVKESIYFFA